MGTEHSHNPIDSKDEQSWKNKIADAERVEKIEMKEEVENALADPTAIAKSHGNEPSKGAKKDKELMHDEEEELRKKDEAKKQSAEHGVGRRGGCGLGRTNALSMFHPHASRGKETGQPHHDVRFRESRYQGPSHVSQKVSEIQGSRPPWT